MARIIHVFFDTDMRCGLPGLGLIASKRGIKLRNVKQGDFLCFVNRAETRIKVLASSGEEDGLGVLGAYQSPRGRIGLDAIQYIPKAFGAGGFNMTSAIRKSLEAKLRKGDSNGTTV